MMVLTHDFGKNLKAIRGKMRVSQRTLASRCGMFPQQISAIETGRVRRLAWETAVRLADGLGVSLDTLASRRGTIRRRPGYAKKIPEGGLTR